MDLLLSAIRDFVESNKKDERYTPAIESLGKVVESLKGVRPEDKLSPGKLAARMAAAPPEQEKAEAPPEKKPEAEQAEQPKTFAEAKAAAKEAYAR